MPYKVFCGPGCDSADEISRIGSLVNAWLKSLGKPLPNAPAARKVERRLHEAIKASPLYGKVLSFAGLNIWVDDLTEDGLVIVQESIIL